MEAAIYVHIPFCVQRCAYCDFNTYAGILDLQETYCDAVCEEARLHAERYRDIQATTLYFGGGTPSLVEAEYIAAIIDAVRMTMSLQPQVEISLEANPCTLNPAKLAALVSAGVNRLSLGVQSAHDTELRRLGRIHTWAQAAEAFRMTRDAGIDNINLDLIYGLPRQTLKRWVTTLQESLALEPDHLSLYALTLEPGTPLAEKVALHRRLAPNIDRAADMYEAASDILHAAGYWQYEISNWARGDAPACWALPPEGQTESIGRTVCHHNLVYWRNGAWLGLGAGAHSFLQGRRWAQHPHPSGYIHAVRRGSLKGVEEDQITRVLDCSETMMMGLRLAEGVTDARFRNRFGVGLQAVYGDVIRRYAELELIEWDGERVRLSPRGRLVGNQVFQDFLLDNEQLPAADV